MILFEGIPFAIICLTAVPLKKPEDEIKSYS